MVYTQILIIYGVPADCWIENYGEKEAMEEIETHMGKEKCNPNEIATQIKAHHKHVDAMKSQGFLNAAEYAEPDENGFIDWDDREITPGVKIYSFPCCHESKCGYIIGRIVRTYVRRNDGDNRCPDCKYYIPGDDSPLVKISDVAPDQKVKKLISCGKCIGLTENGFYDVCAFQDGPIECPSAHMCTFCYHDNRKDFTVCEKCNNEKGIRLGWGSRARPVDEFLKKLGQKGKYYYMVNDCLSCS